MKARNEFDFDPIILIQPWHHVWPDILPNFLSYPLDVDYSLLVDMETEMTVTPCTDGTRSKPEWGNRVCLKDNVDLFYILKEGTPEVVEEAVRRTIEVAAPGGHFIMATSDVMRDGTPVENVHAFCDAGRKYGSYRSSRKYIR